MTVKIIPERFDIELSPKSVGAGLDFDLQKYN